jgi:hypothetical protein
MLSIVASSAAIAVVPPVTYVAVLSLSSFIAGAIALLVSLGAAQAVSMKLWKESEFALASKVISLVGKGAVALSSMLFSVILLNPVDLQSSVLAGTASFLACFLISWLSAYRELVLLKGSERSGVLKKIALFSLAISLLTVSCAFLSTERKVIYSFIPQGAALANQLSPSQNENTGASGMQLPFADSLPSMAKSQGVSPNEASSPAISAVSYSHLILFPANWSDCEVSVGGKVFSMQVTSKCSFLDSNNEIIELPCPIQFNSTNYEGEITAGGSCLVDEKIIAVSGGFELQ